jgi:hypothetical protein
VRARRSSCRSRWLPMLYELHYCLLKVSGCANARSHSRPTLY